MSFGVLDCWSDKTRHLCNSEQNLLNTYFIYKESTDTSIALSGFISLPCDVVRRKNRQDQDRKSEFMGFSGLLNFTVKRTLHCLLILMHSLYSRHPNGPFKTLTGTRRARPRSVFNVRLFNGNLESFIKVLITSLPAWRHSSSYLFLSCSSFLVILVGSPKALELCFTGKLTQKQQPSCLDRGNISSWVYELSGRLGLTWEGGGGSDWSGGGRRRRGMALGQLPWLPADLASAPSPRELLRSKRAREQSGTNGSQRAGSQTDTLCLLLLLLLLAGGRVWSTSHCFLLGFWMRVKASVGSCSGPNLGLAFLSYFCFSATILCSRGRRNSHARHQVDTLKRLGGGPSLLACVHFLHLSCPNNPLLSYCVCCIFFLNFFWTDWSGLNRSFSPLTKMLQHMLSSVSLLLPGMNHLVLHDPAAPVLTALIHSRFWHDRCVWTVHEYTRGLLTDPLYQ